MWCRIILTALAISYVICMLLLSGLQKEDLDASTLEKLSRHDVNIDDMNNERQRQECLFGSLSIEANETKTPVTTEVQDEANTKFEILATDKSVNNDSNIEHKIHHTLDIRLVSNSDSNTVVQNKLEIKNTDNFFGQFPVIGPNITNINNFDNLEHVTQVEDNNNGLSIKYNVQGTPDLESVMNFWTKLTHHAKKVVTKIPTTPPLPIEKNVTATLKIETHNNGYVHSREMEYISRILAEYLASKTVPTTTERIFMKKTIIDYAQLSKKSVNLNNVNNLTTDNVDVSKVNYSYMLDEPKSLPLKEPYVDTQQFKVIQNTLYKQIVPPNLLSSPQIKNDFNISRETIPDNQTTKMIKLLTYENNPRQYTNDVNNIKIKKAYETQHVVMNSEQFKSATATAETWEPVQNYKTKNQQNKISEEPIRKDPEPTNNAKYNPFKPASPIMNKWKQIKNMKPIFFDDIPDINKSEQRNIYMNNNSFKMSPIVHIKGKLYKNSETGNSRFKARLPAMKQAKVKNIFKPTNDEFNGGRPESNKSDQSQNEEMYVDEFKATTETLEQNQSIKVNKYSEELVKNRSPKNYLNDFSELKGFLPVTRKFEPNQDMGNRIKYIPESMNSDGRNRNFVTKNEQPASANVTYLQQNPQSEPIKVKYLKPLLNSAQPLPQFNYKDLNPTPVEVKLTPEKIRDLKPNFGLNMYEPQVIPANIIKEIAEKVKQIVLNDIGKEVSSTVITNTTPVTTNAATSTTTTPAPTTVTTTSSKTTITTTEQPTTAHKEITETHLVIQKLMEIFNEYKAMKETAKLSNQTPNTTIRYSTTNVPIQLRTSPVPSRNNFIRDPYTPHTFGLHESPIVISQNVPYGPQLNKHSDYHSGAITIQTNSDEIAPLAIQITKPMKVMNQHIVVTTRRPIDVVREEQQRQSVDRFERIYRAPHNAANNRETPQLQSDFAKKLRYPDVKNHQFSDPYPYKSRFLKDRQKQWFNNHRVNENVQNSRYPENMNYPVNPRNLNYQGSLTRPRGPYVQPSHQYEMDDHIISPQNGPYRQQPRYDSTKFHEKLERIENWPRNTYKEFKTMATANCEEISARQQMPLMKVKPRARFDDTHFTNFLKSQQKVTDMLEKILANNIRDTEPSAETLR